MRKLIDMENIEVPSPRPDEAYRIEWSGRTFEFQGLKRLLGAADYPKAGEKHAGLAAADELEREAARSLLSGLTLRHLFDRPLLDQEGKVDEVMRVNYAIDAEGFRALADLTVGELKDRLLRATPEEAATVGFSLTGVMAAAVAKLMDTHELIYVARKISRPTRARTQLGLPGTLSSRLQPNHPTDDLRGISYLTYLGLSLGAGDALIGVNPAIDTVENVSGVLHQLNRLRTQLGAPTQICVLAHVKTQLKCLEAGAPVEILFQSLAGTESTNRTEFDISVDLLDNAHRIMLERGPLRGTAEQFFYFETGQGSELTYGKHNGIDMTTTEALCYGLARRYDPFMVNNVTGFIGPETHYDDREMIMSNLQDHFMGKLMGLPMGMAPCYTLHSNVTLEGQQIATELLTSAGANYYMDVCLNTDRMLAYFDTSAHDDQTLREIHAKRTTPEYLVWAIGRGIFVEKGGRLERGPNWGRPEQFAESKAELEALARATPALHGLETAGPRPANQVSRTVRRHQAAARHAIAGELDLTKLAALGDFRIVETAATDKKAHLGSPRLGATLAESSRRALTRESATFQLIVSDGLSAEAVHANIDELVPVLMDGIGKSGISQGRPIVARYGRVKLVEEIASRLGSVLSVLLIGERPGGDAAAAQSLSAYLGYQNEGRFEYSVISNIYRGGLLPVEAGSVILEKARQILAHKAAGNRLEALLAERPGIMGP